MANRTALHDAIERRFRSLSASEIVDRLDRARIAHARLNSVAELVDHEQLVARGCWKRVDSPSGPLRALVPPARLGGVEPVMGPIPSLGQHSAAILEEIGFDRVTIGRWRENGTI